MPIPQRPQQDDVIENFPVPRCQGSRWNPRKTQICQFNIKFWPGGSKRRAAASVPRVCAILRLSLLVRLSAPTGRRRACR